MYLCSPSNPQGAIATIEYWIELIKLAEEFDFKIFAMSAIQKSIMKIPPGALEALNKLADPERVVVFHSLSKRSNLPGLRSGFLATGPKNIKRLGY